MADAFADWYVHTATVETVGPPDEWGAQTTTTHTVQGWLEDKVQLVRNQQGEEVASTATFWCALEHRAKFEPGSPVTVNGRTARVISVLTGDSTDGDELDGIGVTLA